MTRTAIAVLALALITGVQQRPSEVPPALAAMADSEHLVAYGRWGLAGRRRRVRGLTSVARSGPPRVRRSARDFPAAAGGECGGARRTALDAAQAAEGGGVGIRLGEVFGYDADAFRRGVASRARRADLVGRFEFPYFLGEIAHQAAAFGSDRNGGGV